MGNQLKPRGYHEANSNNKSDGINPLLGVQFRWGLGNRYPSGWHAISREWGIVRHVGDPRGKRRGEGCLYESFT